MTTAYYIVATPTFGVTGQTFGIIADGMTAHYVFPDGSGDWEGLDDSRIAMATQELGETPSEPLDWLALATYNLNFIKTSTPVMTPSIEAARTAVLQAIELALPPDAETTSPPAGTNAPQTRDELLAWQREMMDQWAEAYPEAAAGDVDDPEADLALRHYMTPPVDPDKPHQWLPIATTETDCGFCEKPAEDAIHNTEADTITRGSN